MRTVDPVNWSRNITKAPLNLARPMRFGRKPLKNVPRTSGFREALREYERNCSISGVKYITDETKPAAVRYSYAVMLVLLASFGVWSTARGASARGQREPSSVWPRAGAGARALPFPAVGLCPNHVVSTSALTRYVATLMAKRKYRNDTYSAASLARKLAQLGHLLTLSLPRELDASFMNYITSLDPTATEPRLLRKFAPNCTSMLVRCSWLGQTQPCRDLFLMRATPLGYCCIFNSRYLLKDVYKLPRFQEVLGKDYGLSVVVHQDVNDVSSFRRPSHDIDVLVFNGDDYPLVEDALLLPAPAQGRAAVHVALTPTLHYLEDRFDNFIYSQRCERRGWCVAGRRARLLRALCACRLPALPAPASAPDLPHCSLAHLDCLQRHREVVLGVSHAPDCSQRAACARLQFRARFAALHALHPRQDWLTKDIPLENMTSIRLYYSSDRATSYVLRAGATWYEGFVELGSAWALVVGASVVSVSELVFHCALRCRRRPSPAATRR